MTREQHLDRSRTMNEPPASPYPYWQYPDPGPEALAMLPPSPAREQLAALLEEGDADEIAKWIETADIPDAVKTVVRRGLRGEEAYDAVEVGRLAWDDHTSTVTTCVARREGDNILYQAWQDGELIGEQRAERVLSGGAIRNLMVTGDIADDDYEGRTSFVASSAFHPDLEDFDGWEEPDEEE
jgi:hypothetical protein